MTGVQTCALPIWQITDFIHVFLCLSSLSFNKLRYLLFGKRLKSCFEIPIIINNYNRLDYLVKLIQSLESRGYRNIHIIDNNSSYPPLLEYYKSCKYCVYKLNTNVGYKALWKTNIYEKFKKSYYVYTDADLELDNACPDDFMNYFFMIMQKKPFSQKVGFGLKIDDLPDIFINKKQVIDWEKKHWDFPDRQIQNLFRAPIDTTFALYRPFCKGAANRFYETYRTGYPYVVKHLPWYVDSKNLTEEELYYVNNATQSTHWTRKTKLSQNKK